MPSSRYPWLCDAVAVLADALNPQTGPLTLTLSDGSGRKVCLEVPLPAGTQPLPRLDLVQEQAPTSLPPLAQKILQAATTEPQTSKRLAHRCGIPNGHAPTSHFRNTLRMLLSAHLIIKTGDGYRRP